MDKVKLQQLQKLSKDISILYIEDSLNLQKQVGLFLGRMFGNLYQAYDGQEGYEKYKKFKPDIVLTDITMPKKSGIEMIIDIKQINQDAKIIILSAHNDDINLLKAIDMGIIEFLSKPVDMDRLMASLIEAITKDRTPNDEQKCFDELKAYSKKEVNVLNSYKGIPMLNSGKIKQIKDDEIILDVPFIQSIALRYEKQTIIELKNTKKHIQAHLLKYDKLNGQIHLINPKFIKYKSRDLEHKRIVPDKSFHGILHHHTKKVDVKVLEISFISASIFINDSDLDLKVNDKIEVGLVFDIKNKNHLMNESKTTKAYCRGEVLRVESLNSGLKIITSLEVKKSDESTFNKYLQQREMDLVQEFRQLIQKHQ